MTQQGEAEARRRAEPHKEGQRQHARFRVRADKEGEAGAKAGKTGLWRPGCTALERGERKVLCMKTSAPPATGGLSYYSKPPAPVEAWQGAAGPPVKQSFSN